MMILDLRIPGVNGWENYQGLKKVKKFPVIFVSETSFQEKTVKGFGIGTEEHITKPFHNPELLACIKRMPKNTSYVHRPHIRHHPDRGIVIDFDAHDKEMEYVPAF